MSQAMFPRALLALPLFCAAGANAVHAQGTLHQAHPVPIDAGWPSYAHDATHSALSPVGTQSLANIHWQTPVDLLPQYSGSYLLIHYGSPLITPRGTIVVTTKTGTSGGFRIEGHAATSGALLWIQGTDYILPPHNWTPSCGSTLAAALGVAAPAAGGTVMLRPRPDAVNATAQRLCFYGLGQYQGSQATYNANVMIDTPITSDKNGVLYFGFAVQGSTPLGLESGIARLDAATGVGTWISAHAAANDSSIRKVVYNCAPALSVDGSALYVAVNNVSGSGFGTGYLLKLDSQTLALIARVRLSDSWSGLDSELPDDGTASPTVGPDGDVYMGVFENPYPSNNDRGWMLHFNGALTQTKIPGAFGWDDTASIVPANCVPSYTGSSAYLLLTKYNNYIGIGTGNGQNKVAVLDPNNSMTDPITGATVMQEVITVLGPTPYGAGGVTEWCINSAAVDPVRKCALVNNEDGKLYRWDFASNSLSEVITLTAGLGEAYTPTLIGPDGVVYAINNATLFAVGN